MGLCELKPVFMGLLFIVRPRFTYLLLLNEWRLRLVHGGSSTRPIVVGYRKNVREPIQNTRRWWNEWNVDPVVRSCEFAHARWRRYHGGTIERLRDNKTSRSKNVPSHNRFRGRGLWCLWGRHPHRKNNIIYKPWANKRGTIMNENEASQKWRSEVGTRLNQAPLIGESSNLFRL